MSNDPTQKDRPPDDVSQSTMPPEVRGFGPAVRTQPSIKPGDDPVLDAAADGLRKMARGAGADALHPGRAKASPPQPLRAEAPAGERAYAEPTAPRAGRDTLPRAKVELQVIEGGSEAEAAPEGGDEAAASGRTSKGKWSETPEAGRVVELRHTYGLRASWVDGEDGGEDYGGVAQAETPLVEGAEASEAPASGRRRGVVLSVDEMGTIPEKEAAPVVTVPVAGPASKKERTRRVVDVSPSTLPRIAAPVASTAVAAPASAPGTLSPRAVLEVVFVAILVVGGIPMAILMASWIHAQLAGSNAPTRSPNAAASVTAPTAATEAPKAVASQPVSATAAPVASGTARTASTGSPSAAIIRPPTAVPKTITPPASAKKPPPILPFEMEQ